MRVVSMDEASNLFRACFCHGDASFATATRLFQTRKRHSSAHAPKIESGGLYGK